MSRRMIVVLMFCVILPAVAQAQGLGANAGNIRDPRVALVTPAAMGLREAAQIAVGYELLYQGIADDNLQNGFGSIFIPVGSLGAIGVNAQYFSSEIYRQGLFSLGYALPVITEKMSIGLDLGLYNLSYNESNFQLVDANDPVFDDNTSKSALDIGASALFTPTESLFLGLSAKHLNSPNLSLIDDDITAPVSFQTGMMYYYPMVSPLVNLEYTEEEAYFDIGLESWPLRDRAMLRATYGQEDMGIGAAYVIDSPGSQVRFDYEFRYPLSDVNEISSGFHQFVLSYSPLPWGFDLLAQPARQVVYAGESSTFRIDVRRKGRMDQPVSLHLARVSDNILSSFSPSTVRAEEPSDLTFRTDADCPSGEYQFQIVGQADGKERTSSVTLEVRRRELSGDIVASVETLMIEELTRIRSESPLLSYIFFEENQSGLDPGRYQILNVERDPLQQFVFFPEELQDIPSQYKNTLNVIAKRLWDNPEMTITVTGCNSGWGTEKGNTQLSRQRAEAVREYLVQNCGVRPEQVRVQARNEPAEASNLEDPRGRQENQRVEITSSGMSEEILEPIITESTEIHSSDSLCYFRIKDIVADAGMKRWEVEIHQLPDETFHVFRGDGFPEDELVWDWTNGSGRSVEVDKEYGYRLRLWDMLGQTYETEWKKIYVKKVSRTEREFVEKGVEKTRLILFHFDKADLDVSSTALREEMRKIAQRLKDIPEATLLIQGHTDIIGVPEYNRELSVRRAEVVADYFGTWDIRRSRITTEGFGATKPLMNNTLPEGRMMNRRVEIYTLY
jgi:outer membrane protein OmpA-like peptidoglycan-associated protein